MRRVSIPQIGPPNIHRLGAAKNRRAPAGALEETPTVGSAAVLGRINVTTNPTTRFDHANAAPEHSPAGDAQTTCLSPYRHPRGSFTEFGNRASKQVTICGPCRNRRARPKQRACPSICVIFGCAWVAGGMWKINSFAAAFGCQGTKWQRRGRIWRGRPCSKSGGYKFGIIAPHAWSL